MAAIIASQNTDAVLSAFGMSSTMNCSRWSRAGAHVPSRWRSMISSDRVEMVWESNRTHAHTAETCRAVRTLTVWPAAGTPKKYRGQPSDVSRRSIEASAFRKGFIG